MTGEQKPGGLEVVAWLTTGGDVTRSEAYAKDQSVNDPANYPVALTPAEPAEGRIRELMAQLVQSAAIEGDAHRLRLAAEAKLARAVEGLERIREGAHETSFAFSTARQTLAALQQEGE